MQSISILAICSPRHPVTLLAKRLSPLQGKRVGSFPVHRLLLSVQPWDHFALPGILLHRLLAILQGNTSHNRAKDNHGIGKPFSTPGDNHPLEPQESSARLHDRNVHGGCECLDSSPPTRATLLQQNYKSAQGRKRARRQKTVPLCGYWGSCNLWVWFFLASWEHFQFYLLLFSPQHLKLFQLLFQQLSFLPAFAKFTSGFFKTFPILKSESVTTPVPLCL